MFVIEQLRLAPVLLVGQSLGGYLAMLVAARHPELVRALVVAEASPGGGDEAAVEEAAAQLAASLSRWPVPFASPEAAVGYFGGPSLTGTAWTAGLERRDDGLWPRFDVDVMERTLREALKRAYWDEWARIRCPTLIVRAGRGSLDRDEARAMADSLPGARLVEIPIAAHDVHLDRPSEWKTAITGFLDSLDDGVR